MSLLLPKLLTEEALRTSGIQLGAPGVTKDMAQFVEKIDSFGVPIFSFNKMLERLDVAGKFLSTFSPENVVVFSTLDKAEKSIERFATVTGCHSTYGRLYPGTFTNPQMKHYIETQILVLTDPMNGAEMKEEVKLERKREARAMDEASIAGIPIIAFCNTNASLENVDLVIPMNNRGTKALAVGFYLLARAVLIHQGLLKPEEDAFAVESFETPLKEEKEDHSESDDSSKP